MITNFEAVGSGDHVVLSWLATAFDTNPVTRFEVFRSVDGGVTFDSCATDQAGECLSAEYTETGFHTFTLYDYGVRNNFKYSYRIEDSEGEPDWYMAVPFQGAITKPVSPSPATAPSFTLSDLWTDGVVAKAKINLALTGMPPRGTVWAHSYTLSYYGDYIPTVTVTGALRGSATIALGQDPLPVLRPLTTYHIKIRANGMSADTPYSAEQHVRILPRPDLYHAAVVGGTTISLQWKGVDWSSGVQYDVLYQKVGPAPTGNLVVVNAGTQRVWRLSGLAPQSVYEVQVRARDQWGNPSPASLPLGLETGTASPTDVSALPQALELRATPTPFSPRTSRAQLTFGLPQAGRTQLVVYDARGRLVRRIFQGTKPAGMHVATWDGSDDHGHSVSSGVYIIHLSADERTLKQKLVLAR